MSEISFCKSEIQFVFYSAKLKFVFVVNAKICFRDMKSISCLVNFIRVIYVGDIYLFTKWIQLLILCIGSLSELGTIALEGN